MRCVHRIPDVAMTRALRVWLRIESVFNLFYKRELRELKKLWIDFTEDPLKVSMMCLVNIVSTKDFVLFITKQHVKATSQKTTFIVRPLPSTAVELRN